MGDAVRKWGWGLEPFQGGEMLFFRSKAFHPYNGRCGSLLNYTRNDDTQERRAKSQFIKGKEDS